MKNILAIQTIKDSLEVALLSYGNFTSKSWLSNKDEVAKVLPMVEELLEENKTEYRNLEGILVVNGVGAFSATRIGVTIANSLAFALNIPLFQVTVKKNTEIDFKKMAGEVEQGLHQSVKIAAAVYDTAPMISPSKKQKFV
jgi:tRNA threonylcarbamoyl adenosine modification protein YeaZ